MLKLLYFLLGFLFGLLFGRFVLADPPVHPSPPTLRKSVEDTFHKDLTRHDDLTRIAGIGPAFASALEAIDIRSFAVLARQDADALAARLPGRVTADRIRRDQWIEQARSLSQP